MNKQKNAQTKTEFELKIITAYWAIFIETMPQTYPYNLLSRIPLHEANVVGKRKQLSWKSVEC